MAKNKISNTKVFVNNAKEVSVVTAVYVDTEIVDGREIAVISHTNPGVKQ